MRTFVSGACYQDVILHVDQFPREDQKLRANEVEKRRGGNGANVLQVLSQFQKNSNSLSTALIAVLAGDGSDAQTADSFILNDLNSSLSNVALDHCVFRGHGYSEPTAWIIATKHSRTVINHTTLPELTVTEFKASMKPVIDAHLETPQPESLWFHFEGRNVSEMEQMVDWLIETRELAADRAENEGKREWWQPVNSKSGVLPPPTVSLAPEMTGIRRTSLNSMGSNEIGDINVIPAPIIAGISPGENVLGKKESKEGMRSSTTISSAISPLSLIPQSPSVEGSPSLLTSSSQAAASATSATPAFSLPQFTISVEFEKPNRPGLDNLLPKSDILFFSKWYAEGRGFPQAPTGFLDNIRRECKPGAILFLTWAEQGCFFLVNETTRPARTHHVGAPQIYPVDTIGAGDTFAAGILYALGVLGMDVLNGCEFAVRLATAKCAQVGFDGLAERVY